MPLWHGYPGDPSWARHGAGHTRTFDDQVAWLVTHTSKTAVVELMRVAWRTVGAIAERVVADDRAASVPDARLESARIAALVGAGFMVRTRADDSGVEARANDSSRAAAALASGAQLVSTDYPVPAPSGYVVAAPGNPPRCNPLNTPPGLACTPADVEALG